MTENRNFVPVFIPALSTRVARPVSFNFGYKPTITMLQSSCCLL